MAMALGKYDGLSSSAQEESTCGLAVDMHHTSDTSTGNVIAPIECLDNVDYRSIPLLHNSYLQFKSRVMDGMFTR
jgi:hypothetical protein